jgi:hypothetical protein
LQIKSEKILKLLKQACNYGIIRHVDQPFRFDYKFYISRIKVNGKEVFLATPIIQLSQKVNNLGLFCGESNNKEETFLGCTI